jgi:recombination protein RecR
MGGPEVERLIALLARLPGMGPRSARRAALRMLAEPETRMLPLATALTAAARAVSACSTCGNLDTRNPCMVCADNSRDRGLVCVVETVSDLWALERTRTHHGLYHVLGATLSALGGVTPDDIDLSLLLRRLDGAVREIILALPATVDGAATTHWLAEKLAQSGIAVTRLAHGVPIGGSLDILDDGTLATALKARRPVG